MRKHYPLNPNGVEDAGRLPWTDGVPSTGTEGSYPGYALVVDTESEVLAAQDVAGLVRNGQDQTQLGQAIARGVYLGAFGGSANALTAALPNNVTWPSLLPGMRFSAIASQPNTGSVTITLGGFTAVPGALNLLRRDSQALQAGDIQPGLVTFVYDGTSLRVAIVVASEIAVSTTTVINNKRIVGGVPTPFNSAGTYTVPVDNNVTFRLTYRGAGGGGGGADAVTSAGSGGGGGGYGEFVGTTTSPCVLQVIVGAGGAGGAGGAPAGQGAGGGATTWSVISGTLTDAAGNTYTAGQSLGSATGGGFGYGGTGGPQPSQFGVGGVAAGGVIQRSGQAGGFPRGPFVGNTFLGGSGGTSPLSGGPPGDNQGAGGNVATASGTGGNGSSANAPGGAGTAGEAAIFK